MNNNSRKRSRKSKLEVRACNELDDEKHGDLQDNQFHAKKIKEEVIEIEESPLNSDDIHLKESNVTEQNNTDTKPSVDFKINIEIEEYREDDNQPRYRIETTQNSSKSNEEISKPKHKHVASKSKKKRSGKKKAKQGLYNPMDVTEVDLDELYEDVNNIVSSSDNIADKIMGIELRNFWGMALMIPQKEDPRDTKLEEVIHKWKIWHNSSKYRDVPLLYKCYICESAWWHLDPFRSHLQSHNPDSYRLEIEESSNEASIFAYGTVNIPVPKDIYTEGECWKCNKPYEQHTTPNKQNGLYACKCCEEKFHTCVDLKIHEGVCWQYLKHLELERDHVMIMCNLCKCLFATRSELAKHMGSRHTVRSDVPIQPQYRSCTKCNLKYFIYTIHHCPKKIMCYDCKHCTRSYGTKLAVDLHIENTKSNVHCKICNIILPKQCMEVLHYKKHSKNFQFAYKCMLCDDMKVYSDLRAIGDHRWVVHKQNDKRRLHLRKVILPKNYYDEAVESEEENVEAPVVENKKECPRLEVKKTALQKTYQNKGPSQKQVVQDPEPQILVADVKTEQQSVDAVGVDTPQCTVEEIEPTPLIYFEEPVYVIQTEIKSEPLDEDYEEDIIRLSMDKLSEESVIKQEPEEFIVKTEPTEEFDDIFVKEEPIEMPLEQLETGNSLTIKPKVILKPRGKERPKIYTCRKCGYRDVHRKYKEHISYNCKAMEPRTECIKPRYPCPECRKNATSFKKYILHFEKHGYEYMSCPVCCEQFENMTKLFPHVMGHVKQSFLKLFLIENRARRRTSNEGIYQCKFCKGKVGQENMCGHWVTHSKVWSKHEDAEKRIVETVENVALETEGLMSVIEYLQADPAKYKIKVCVICERNFERKNDCKRHLIEHLLTDAYMNKPKYGSLRCQICGQQYCKAEHYKLHMREHGSLPVYRCDLCERSFSDSSNFTKHKKVHNLQVHVCDICCKKFQAKASLVKHMEMHSKIEPMHCNSCEKIFYTQSALSKHIRLYHDKGAHKCKCRICGEKFLSLKDQWDHQWLVHQERKHKADCPICQKPFRKMRDVGNHLKNEHAMKKSNAYGNSTGIEEFLKIDANFDKMETLIIYES